MFNFRNYFYKILYTLKSGNAPDPVLPPGLCYRSTIYY